MKHICIGITAHVDAGKTTLSEAMLYQAGALKKLGRVDHQDAFLDTFALERARGITIFSKQAEFSLADTEVTLVVTQNGQTTELPMSGSGGVFTAPVSLPVEDTGEVSFAANITTGGQTSREEVTSYSDLAMLLPLTNDGSGYGDPTYRGGSFQLQYDLGIRKQYGTEVIDPVFQVLKNGDSVQTLPAKISESTFSSDPDAVYYTPDTAEGDIVVSCQPKDTVELHLLCRDSFGLSYDFTVCTYAIGENGDIARIESDTDHNVRVSWEK